MKKILVAAIFAVSLPVLASDSSNLEKKEIEHLITHMASSGCEFNRNGTWYDASRAAGHLKQKYEYLLKRNAVPTAEAFIEGAASESSVSGKSYLVRCGSQPEVRSAVWFRAELAKFRAESSNAAANH
jgi:hypothetical protein